MLSDVHWLRIVVDEGHFLGGGALTNSKTLLSALHAERRWVLSGTPARGTSDADGLSAIYQLLCHLQLPEREQWRALAHSEPEHLPNASTLLTQYHRRRLSPPGGRSPTRSCAAPTMPWESADQFAAW